MSGYKKSLHRLRRTRHLFPIAIISVMLILTVLKISGTSSGVFFRIHQGVQENDPSLLFGKPRDIRSDEWEVVTQLTLAQEAENYPRLNENIGFGNDVSVVMDLPYREWSVLFRPQNLSFFVLPFEQAFALKWWSLFSLLLISTYYLAMRFTRSHRLMSALISLSFAYSPFIMWWYQTITIGTFAFALTAILLTMRIADIRPLKLGGRRLSLRITQVILSTLLAYSMVCFGLVLYPPFQIPVAIVSTAFVVGILYGKLSAHPRKELYARCFFPVIVSVLASGAVMGLFVFTRSEAIQAIQNTAYPGTRHIENGDANPVEFFSGFLAPQFQINKFAVHYYTNQSEASMFMYFGLYLLPAITYFYTTKKQRDLYTPAVISLGIVVVLFMTKLFVEQLTPLSEVTLLTKVASIRMMSGFGLMSLLLLLLWIAKEKVTITRLNALLGTLILSVTLLWTGFYLRMTYPGFIDSPRKILLACFLYSTIFYLLLRRRFIFGLLLLCSYTIFSVVYINPLYIGIQPKSNDPLISAIQSTGTEDSTWAVAYDLVLENYPLAAGRRSLTGVAPYPNVPLWKQIYPDESPTTYNRYAHTILIDDRSIDTELFNPQADIIHIDLSCEANILENTNYVLSPREIPLECFQLVREVPRNAQVYYIYKVLARTP